jgi:hypothetical protein
LWRLTRIRARETDSGICRNPAEEIKFPSCEEYERGLESILGQQKELFTG